MAEMLDPTETQQVLSQSEVENLLAQVAEQENAIAIHTVDQGRINRAADSILPYDFRHPVFLSPAELRRLRLRHEDFIRELTARLSLYLRIEFGMQMSRLETVLYRKFAETLNNPTHLCLFRAEPLPGVCILEIHRRLGLTMVDRLLGGPAHSVNAEHDLSEIELALLEQVEQIILSEWCNHWRGLQELRPVTLGHETSGRFLQTSAHDAVMLVLSVEARLGDCLETIQMGFPYYTLEPLIRSLAQSVESMAADAPSTKGAGIRWNPQFDDVRVPVAASWRDLEMRARDIAALRVGDILEIAPSCVDQVSVHLAERPSFRGRLGTKGKNWAVELTEPIRQ